MQQTKASKLDINLRDSQFSLKKCKVPKKSMSPEYVKSQLFPIASPSQATLCSMISKQPPISAKMIDYPKGFNRFLKQNKIKNKISESISLSESISQLQISSPHSGQLGNISLFGSSMYNKRMEHSATQRVLNMNTSSEDSVSMPSTIYPFGNRNNSSTQINQYMNNLPRSSRGIINPCGFRATRGFISQACNNRSLTNFYKKSRNITASEISQIRENVMNNSSPHLALEETLNKIRNKTADTENYWEGKTMQEFTPRSVIKEMNIGEEDEKVSENNISIREDNLIEEMRETLRDSDRTRARQLDGNILASNCLSRVKEMLCHKKVNVYSPKDMWEMKKCINDFHIVKAKRYEDIDRYYTHNEILEKFVTPKNREELRLATNDLARLKEHVKGTIIPKAKRSLQFPGKHHRRKAILDTGTSVKQAGFEKADLSFLMTMEGLKHNVTHALQSTSDHYTVLKSTRKRVEKANEKLENQERIYKQYRDAIKYGRPRAFNRSVAEYPPILKTKISGQTAMNLAIKRGHLNIVKELISYGISPYKTDNLGRNAFQIAEIYEDNNIMMFFHFEYNYYFKKLKFECNS